MPRASLPVSCHQPNCTVSYPRLHLPLKKLQELFQQQLSMELATTVTVESVEKAPPLTKEVLHAVRAHVLGGSLHSPLPPPPA